MELLFIFKSREALTFAFTAISQCNKGASEDTCSLEKFASL